MKAIHRLNKFLELKGLTPAAFEKACDLSNGYFAGQLRKNGSVGSDILEQIAKTYPELNMSWVITGKGYMVLSTQKTSKEDELANQRLEEEREVYIAKTKATELIKELDILLKGKKKTPGKKKE